MSRSQVNTNSMYAYKSQVSEDTNYTSSSKFNNVRIITKLSCIIGGTRLQKVVRRNDVITSKFIQKSWLNFTEFERIDRIRIMSVLNNPT